MPGTSYLGLPFFEQATNKEALMSNMDFNDPEDPNFRPRTTSYGSSWGWIAGAVAIVVVLFLIWPELTLQATLRLPRPGRHPAR